jgi:hypothetical protein
VIGKNPLWKQDVQLGKRNDQQFVQIPHARFIDQLTYKARLVGIQVKLQEESYTSKASFLDNDPLPTYQADRVEQPVFSGKRIARSWYRASDGTVLHADINGSYNILRKSSSDTRANGARSSGRGSSPQTAGALKRMTHRHIGRHFKILFDKLAEGAEQERYQELHELPIGTYGQFYDKYGVQWIFLVRGEQSEVE